MASNKEIVNAKKEQLYQLTTGFSQRYLNEEYEIVIKKLIDKMARKREVPFVTGKIEIWAAAVIHALGTMNFLFDKASQPYVPVGEIYEFFNTKQSTTSQRSKKIRGMFGMNYFDGEFSTGTVRQNSPLNQLKMFNGFIVPTEMVEQQDGETSYLEEWELKVAEVLGVSELIKKKMYTERELYGLLGVNDERLNLFHDYLSQHLTFPFPATVDKEEGPFMVVRYEFHCTKLIPKKQIDDQYGIFIEGIWEDEKIIPPLSLIDLPEDNANYSLIDAYQEWFWNYG